MKTIIENEAAREYMPQLCENCGYVKPARWIRVVGIVKEDRGNYMICFDCYGPVIKWKDDRNIVFESPARPIGI